MSSYRRADGRLSLDSVHENFLSLTLRVIIVNSLMLRIHQKLKDPTSIVLFCKDYFAYNFIVCIV